MAKVVKKGKVSRTTAKKSRLSKSVAKKSRFSRTVARKEKFSELNGKKIYSATNDLIFKKVFGENEIVVQDFLSSILKIPKDEFEIIHYENPFMNISDVADDKTGILDVKIKTKSGMVADIEMVRPSKAA